MERTVKLTLLSERATSLLLTVITALLHLPGRSSMIRLLLRAKMRYKQTPSEVPARIGNRIPFFFCENATNGKHKRRRASSEKEFDLQVRKSA